MDISSFEQSDASTIFMVDFLINFLLLAISISFASIQDDFLSVLFYIKWLHHFYNNKNNKKDNKSSWMDANEMEIAKNKKLMRKSTMKKVDASDCSNEEISIRYA